MNDREEFGSEPQRSRLSVELSHTPLTSILELHNNYGMMYSTTQARSAFFERAKSEPRSVEYWSALSHARGTNVGLWGNDESLYQDCSQIMAYELQRAQMELGIRPDVIPKDVENSRSFREAYSQARTHKEAALHNLVRALGDNHTHMDHKQAKPLEGESRNQMKYLHVDVLVELTRISEDQAYQIIKNSGTAELPHRGALPDEL